MRKRISTNLLLVGSIPTVVYKTLLSDMIASLLPDGNALFDTVLNEIKCILMLLLHIILRLNN